MTSCGLEPLSYGTVYSLDWRGDHWAGQFQALGGPCEILAETERRSDAVDLVRGALAEAKRIEHKFSRYREDSVVSLINASSGRENEVDGETADLLDYAAECFEFSDGLFDITTGVLRRAWTFDGGDRLPAVETIARLARFVGWHRVNWRRPVISLPDGMEIDFGGIGKEYAVDRAAGLLSQQTSASFVVNFGGDLFVSEVRADGRCWSVGVDDPESTGTRSTAMMEVERGGIATSGDARRFVMKDGIRYSHILDPRTGYPVAESPRSVTVAASTCIEAGTIATIAMLKGSLANSFLKKSGAKYFVT